MGGGRGHSRQTAASDIGPSPCSAGARRADQRQPMPSPTRSTPALAAPGHRRRRRAGVVATVVGAARRAGDRGDRRRGAGTVRPCSRAGCVSSPRRCAHTRPRATATSTPCSAIRSSARRRAASRRRSARQLLLDDDKLLLSSGRRLWTRELALPARPRRRVLLRPLDVLPAAPVRRQLRRSTVSRWSSTTTSTGSSATRATRASTTSCRRVRVDRAQVHHLGRSRRGDLRRHESPTSSRTRVTIEVVAPTRSMPGSRETPPRIRCSRAGNVSGHAALHLSRRAGLHAARRADSCI